MICSVIYVVCEHKAHVDIVLSQKHQIVELKHQEFVLDKTKQSPIDFEVMIVSDTQKRDILLTKTKTISDYAQGDILFSNSYSANPEKISANSFVSDESGKAYKLDKAVIVPGYTMSKSKKIPGTVSAHVTAFLPGDTYNGNPKNFYISSYKGTKKYNTIYGTAQSAISGGAMGLVYVIGDDTKALLAIANLKSDASFESNLIKKIEVPSGYILYPRGVTFTSDVDDQVMSPTPQTKIDINSTLSAIILKKDDVSKFLIKNSIPNITNSELGEIKIQGLDSLNFSFKDPNQLVHKDLQSVDFYLDGPIDMVWMPDIGSLKDSLLGVPFSTVQSIFHQDPGISSATVKIFPPWERYLPSNRDVVKIVTQ